MFLLVMFTVRRDGSPLGPKSRPIDCGCCVLYHRFRESGILGSPRASQSAVSNHGFAGVHCLQHFQDSCLAQGNHFCSSSKCRWPSAASGPLFPGLCTYFSMDIHVKFSMFRSYRVFRHRKSIPTPPLTLFQVQLSKHDRALKSASFFFS